WTRSGEGAAAAPSVLILARVAVPRVPQLVPLRLHPRMEPRSEVARNTERTDKGLHVREVPQPTGVAHSGSELQFDQLLERDVADVVLHEDGLDGGIWEHDRLGVVRPRAFACK